MESNQKQEVVFMKDDVCQTTESENGGQRECFKTAEIFPSLTSFPLK